MTYLKPQYHLIIASVISIFSLFILLSGFLWADGKKSEQFATKVCVQRRIAKTRSAVIAKIRSHQKQTTHLKRRMRSVEIRLVRIDERTKITADQIKQIAKKIDAVLLYFRRKREK